jgi:hypothetical protein
VSFQYSSSELEILSRLQKLNTLFQIIRLLRYEVVIYRLEHGVFGVSDPTVNYVSGTTDYV